MIAGSEAVLSNYELPPAILGLDLGNHDLTEGLMKNLTEHRYSHTTAEREVARGTKKKLRHITLDLGTKMKASAESSDEGRTHQLPDGSSDPVVKEVSGNYDPTFQPIMKRDTDIRKDLGVSIGLTGDPNTFYDIGEPEDVVVKHFSAGGAV